MDYIVCYSENSSWHKYDEQTKRYRGYLVDLMKYVSKAANSSYQESNVCGKGPTCMSLLIQEECDIIVGANTPSNAISSLFYYSPGYYTSDMVMISSLPENEFSVMSNLDINFKIVAAVLFTATVFSIITYLADKVMHRRKKEVSMQNNFCDTLWTYFSTIFLERYNLPSFSISSKILQAIWWFTLIIFISAMGGSFKAHLAFSKDDTINTLQDVATRLDVTPVVVNQSFAMYYFVLGSVIGILKKIRERLVIPVSLLEFIDNPNTLLKDGNVLFEDEMYFLELMEGKCTESWKPKLYISSQAIVTTPYIIYMDDSIPGDIKEIISRKVTQFAETNQMVPGMRNLIRDTSNCFRTENTWSGLRGQHSFLIDLWITGNSVATVTLLIEIVLYKCKLF